MASLASFKNINKRRREILGAGPKGWFWTYQFHNYSFLFFALFMLLFHKSKTRKLSLNQLKRYQRSLSLTFQFTWSVACKCLWRSANPQAKPLDMSPCTPLILRADSPIDGCLENLQSLYCPECSWCLDQQQTSSRPWYTFRINHSFLLHFKQKQLPKWLFCCPMCLKRSTNAILMSGIEGDNEGKVLLWTKYNIFSDLYFSLSIILYSSLSESVTSNSVYLQKAV